MNKHEVFAKVKAHLLAQGRRSVFVEDTEMCAYRDGMGNSCAVGCLIPDDRYNSYIENLPVSDSAVLQFLTFDVNEEMEALLTDLQLVHDRDHPAYWETSLASVASRYGIKEPS